MCQWTLHHHKEQNLTTGCLRALFSALASTACTPDQLQTLSESMACVTTVMLMTLKATMSSGLPQTGQT